MGDVGEQETRQDAANGLPQALCTEPVRIVTQFVTLSTAHRQLGSLTFGGFAVTIGL